MPVGSSETCIWLMWNEDQRLPQMIKQVEKLEDVLACVPAWRRPCRVRAAGEFFRA